MKMIWVYNRSAFLIIASAETLIDKSLQGLQVRLNDRPSKKQGNSSHGKMSVPVTLCDILLLLFTNNLVVV